MSDNNDDLGTPQDAANQLKQLFEQMEEDQALQRRKRAYNRYLRNGERDRRLEDESAMAEFLQPYLKLDTWLVYAEAMPLSLAIHPDEAEESGYLTTLLGIEVKQHIEAAKYTSLKVINPKDQPDEWRVIPSAFIKWLNDQGLSSTAPVSNVASRQLKKGDAASKAKQARSNAQTLRHAKNREAVLYAVVGALANFYEECTENKEQDDSSTPERKRKDSLVTAKAIYELVEDKAGIWFDDAKLPLGDEKIITMLKSAIALERMDS